MVKIEKQINLNLIFFTMVDIRHVAEKNIYTDLMRKFRDVGYEVYIVTPRERRYGMSTELKDVDGTHILGVRTLNLQKTNVIEKCLGQVSIETLFTQAVKKYLGDIHFDLILYSTPPITLTGVVRYLKRKNPQAVNYLLLKDIFPQNAVDLGMFGEKSLFNRWFRRKEVSLYKSSDYIGCMSPANVKYLLTHNTYLDKNKVEVAPNSVELMDNKAISIEEKVSIRLKYNLPTDKPIFIYGGNLGKPQGVLFLIDCLEAMKDREDCHFLIIGTGTELHKLQAWYTDTKPQSVTVMNGLPKEDYDKLVRVCDVGLIFLDHRFTIPNYPSRILSYMENKMPIIAATDPNTDIGSIAESNEYGYWCESNSVEAFTACVDKMLASDVKQMGEKAYAYLKSNYTVDNTYNTIVKHL